MACRKRITLGWGLCLLAVCLQSNVHAQKAIVGVLPEATQLKVRDPAGLPRAYLPAGELPATVRNDSPERTARPISLDEAIRIALANADVIRVLTGVGATNSGRSIFDPAITNTTIDQAQARFDPVVDSRQDFLRNETPFAELDPADPGRVLFDATRNDLYDMSVGVTKQSSTGAEASVRINTDRLRLSPITGVLNPQSRPSLTLGARQPLLQGAGVDVNLVPVVLARIDTERSFFRLKDSLQELVRGVIEAYWSVVLVRTQIWAIEQQLEQTEFDLRRAQARVDFRIQSKSRLTQAQVAYENFNTSLIIARGNLLDREAALRSIMGLPPTGPEEFVPVTPPTTTEFGFDWPALVELAEVSRPDIIELKLVLEADYQQLLQSRNAALPQLDASAIYRWNGLEGELITTGDYVDASFDNATDWRVGVDFSVPLGLRQGRARLRQQQLIIARDRANLNQALLEVLQALSASIRSLNLQYAQYQAALRTRKATAENLRLQRSAVELGTSDYINLLLAVSDWGNAISEEARALTQYNSSLANLERQAGTILEAHGIYFYEERYRSLGPLGILRPKHCYPRDLRPEPNADRYEHGSEPAENSFDLEALGTRGRDSERDAERLQERRRRVEGEVDDLRGAAPPEVERLQERRRRIESEVDDLQSSKPPEIERLPIPFDFDNANFED